MKQLDRLVTKMAGFEKHYAVTGQTYSRKVDVECLNALSSLGSTVHKVNNCVLCLHFFLEMKIKRRTLHKKWYQYKYSAIDNFNYKYNGRQKHDCITSV